ncbi:MAG: TonB-dependent receptor plug domain-containing protein [Acidobacteriaceae bacterium]
MELLGNPRIFAVCLLCLIASTSAVRGEDASSLNAAHAQNANKQLKSLSLEQLGNVEVVTFNKTPTELWNTPAALYVITSEDILRSGVTSIADALRLAPGVEVGRLSSTTWAVGIRGLQNNFSKSVLVLIDGRNVYTPLFAGVYWDVQDMPLDNIDRIEVIRGPGGTIWGPNAANGVINIITKKSADTQGIRATALVGNEDRTIDDLQVGSTAHDVSFRVYGRGFEREHEYHSDGINDDNWHQERLGLRADKTSGRDAYFMEGDLYRGDSPHIIGTTPQYDETSGGDINLRWQRTFNDASGFTLQGYFDRTLRTNTALGETRNTIDIDFIQHLPIGSRQQFSFGAGLRWSPYHIISMSPGENLIPAVATDHVHTGFLEDQIDLGGHVSLTAGAKLQHNNYSGFDIQPSGRLLWSPSEHQSVWTGVTRAVTTPSDIEEDFLLQGIGGTTVVQLLGNHRFKSEDLIGYEAGYRRLINNKAFVDVATFYNQYTRLQSFSAPAVTTSDGYTYITINYENQIAGSTAGFEVTPQFALTSWWRLNTDYSFLNSHFHANGATADISSTGSVNTYDKSSPKHMATIQSRLDLPMRFEFDQLYRYVSDLPAQKVKAYQTMDLRLGRPLGRDLAFEVVGQNLFQHVHDEWGSGDPNQPVVGIYRAAYVQLTFRTKTLHPN